MMALKQQEDDTLHRGVVSIVSDNELREESEWIFNRTFSGIEAMKNSASIIVPKIIHILEFIRKDKLEVPFIYHYRKDYYLPELRLSDLWEIYEWDEKWAHLQQKKQALRTLYS